MRRALAWMGIFLVQGVMWAAPAAAESDLLFGQQHSYSVTMRGNGEAVVTARIVLANTADKPLTSFAFEIPGLKMGDLVGYQQQLVPECLNYGDPKSSGEGTPASGTPQVELLQRPCSVYAQPDYSQPVDSSAANNYSRLIITNSGGSKYQVQLPKPVPPQESTALLLGYSGTGYATRQFGMYRFNFQTIKVQQRIKTATVALDVDSGLFLQDGKSKVNYESNASGSAASLSAGASGAPSSKSLDSIAYGVGQDNGAVYKETHDLAAGESYSVRGSYADAAWKLHPWRVGGLAALGVGMLALAVWLVRRVGRKRPVAAKTAHESKAGHAWPSLLDPVFIVIGLSSAVAVGLLTWGVAYYGQQTLPYEDSFVNTISMVIEVLAYGLLVAGPALWLAAWRRDWRVAVNVFVWQVVWLTALLMVYQFGIRPLLPDSVGTPIPVPYDAGGAEAK
jgi:hypothetical protein